tara:strand:- start:338 stop:592 length:255 start_codon:yes stop_codon:yes gene_type:complete
MVEPTTKGTKSMSTQSEKSKLFQRALRTASIQYINEGDEENAGKMLSILNLLKGYKSDEIADERCARIYDAIMAEYEGLTGIRP